MDQYIYTATEQNELMPENDYEVRIEKIERKILPSGKEKLSVMFRVRNDVEQPYKNKCVFEDIWQEREHPQFFNRKRVNQLLGTQHLKDGTVFENINAIIDFLKGVNLIIHITQEHDDYNDKDVNVVQFYKSTNVKERTIGQAETPKIEIDETVPF